MKHFISILFTFISLVTFAQTQDATQFLGIPIDGYKSEIIQKLKAKGFVEKYTNGVTRLEGEFNGEDVNIHIGTDNNKVWRIYLADKNHRSAEQIRLRFNTLVRQFARNPKYITDDAEKFLINDDENINIGLSTQEQKYSATFYQCGTIDRNIIEENIIQTFLITYQEFPETLDSLKIADPNNYELIMTGIKEGGMSVENAKVAFLRNTEIDADSNWENMVDGLVKLSKMINGASKQVWFTISKFGYDKYYISMYYDNLLNRSNGEDL